jgi:alkyl hydroperoxide reductase subunit F
MLDSKLKGQLKDHLQRISRPVELVASIDDGDRSREMLELLHDIQSVCDRISIDVRRNDASVRRSHCANSAEPRFAGLPMGHEFTSLVLACCKPAAIRRRSTPRRSDRSLTANTASRPSCPSPARLSRCGSGTEPDGRVNPKVRHTMIDGAVFQDECRRGSDNGAGNYLNGQPFGQGRMELAEILARLYAGSAAREAAHLRAKAPFDVLVIGGGAAGAAAAIYAARKGIRTGIAAERLGGQLLDTVGIENFISVKETQGHSLAAGLEGHVATYDVT